MIGNNTVSFSGRIENTGYFNEALNLVNGKRTDDLSLSERAEFATALELIKNDKSIDTFEINAVPGTEIRPGEARPVYININDETQGVFNGRAGVGIADGYQCIAHVIKFAKKRYGDFSNGLIKQTKMIEEASNDLCKKIGEKAMKIANTDNCKIFQRHIQHMQENPEMRKYM